MEEGSRQRRFEYLVARGVRGEMSVFGVSLSVDEIGDDEKRDELYRKECEREVTA